MKTNIYGHRGCKGTLPENTLLGFQRAIDLGVDGLEVDVHLTKDGELVVIHDETMGRTTDGTGWVGEMTYPEIQRFSAGSRFSELPAYKKEWDLERIPTLQELLEMLVPFEMELNIELKTYAVPYEGIEKRVLETVKQYGGGCKVVYSSFHLPTLTRLKELDASAQTAWLLNGPISLPGDYMKTFNFESLHLAKDVYFAHEAEWEGLADRLRIWTVNDPAEMAKLIEAGVKAIITDFPEQALTIRHEQTAPV